MTDFAETQTQNDNGILWASETPWPEGIEATAWCYRTWSLKAIDPWGLTDELDALSIPWRMMDPDSADPIFYTPAGDVVAEMVMTDAGLFKPFSFFEEGAQ